MLSTNTRLRTVRTGDHCIIKRIIGSGGQGEVYEVEVNGSTMALKWYYPFTATSEQRQILEILIDHGFTDPRFLMPLDIVELENPGHPKKTGKGKDTKANDSRSRKNKDRSKQKMADGERSFGYLMELKDPVYQSMVKLLTREIEPDFHTLITSAYNLVDAFIYLHLQGYAYKDMNLNNVFMDPATGKIVIIDNDNVVVNGYKGSNIGGTYPFMAPEIVRGDASPTINTDLHSMAVLLFNMFFLDHPLHGRKEYMIHCWDEPAMRSIYGEDPVYIFDPGNDSNRPIPGYHMNPLEFSRIYPDFFMKFFERSLCDGIRNPGQRVRETVWRQALIRLRDCIQFCSCGAENFHCSNDPGSNVCWKCRNHLPNPLILETKDSNVVLNFNTTIYAHHVDSSQRYNFKTVIAVVLQHPKHPDVWGLKNVSGGNWIIRPHSGDRIVIGPERSVTMKKDMKIDFGSSRGKLLIGGSG